MDSSQPVCKSKINSDRGIFYYFRYVVEEDTAVPILVREKPAQPFAVTGRLLFRERRRKRVN